MEVSRTDRNGLQAMSTWKNGYFYTVLDVSLKSHFVITHISLRGADGELDNFLSAKGGCFHVLNP